MNIIGVVIVLILTHVKLPLGSLDGHSRRYSASKVHFARMKALMGTLNTFVELICLYRVGAITWTRYYLIFVVLAIEIDFLCLILVLVVHLGMVHIA